MSGQKIKLGILFFRWEGFEFSQINLFFCFVNLLTISYKNVLGGKKKKQLYDRTRRFHWNRRKWTYMSFFTRSVQESAVKLKSDETITRILRKIIIRTIKKTTRQFYKKLWIHTIQCKSLNSYRRALMIRRRRIWLYIGTYTYSFSLTSLAIICVDRFLHHMWEFFEDTDISSDHDFTQDDFLDFRSWKILIKNLQYLIASCRVCTSKTIIIQIDI